MTIQSKTVVETARKWCGTKYAHQGRNRAVGLDCGGLLLVVGKELRLTDLEELGYASFPQNGRFEQLLDDHAIRTGFESVYPHDFTGEEFAPGDILAFDYQNGEGIRHTAFISKFDGANYWIIHAIPAYGVTEMPLRHPFSKARLIGFRLRGVE